jgi:uncharacterized protein (DUF427 family)
MVLAGRTAGARGVGMNKPMRVEPCAKRIRGVAGDVTVVDSTHARYVWRDRPYPTYYFPADDVHADFRHRGDADLDGLVAFRWSAMDHWFEEDEEVYVHARDPYTRVDILPSSRTVHVEVDGVTLAASDRPTLLFETGLRTRFYFSPADVRFELLVPTDRVTACPYKGTARYWSARVGDRLHENLAWAYDDPLPESRRIAGLIAFYDERVDLVVDGEREGRPVS